MRFTSKVHEIELKDKRFSNNSEYEVVLPEN